MYCPQCESEYVAGVQECAVCGVPLIDAPPAVAPKREKLSERPCDVHLGPEPVVVFSTGKPDVIALAKSILMSANMEFGIRGEELQDLFGWGRFPAGSNVFMGPMDILVSAEDAADAKVLLADLDSPSPTPAAYELAAESTGPATPSPLWRRAKYAGKIVVVFLLGWSLVSMLLALRDLL